MSGLRGFFGGAEAEAGSCKLLGEGDGFEFVLRKAAGLKVVGRPGLVANERAGSEACLTGREKSATSGCLAVRV